MFWHAGFSFLLLDFFFCLAFWPSPSLRQMLQLVFWYSQVIKGDVLTLWMATKPAHMTAPKGSCRSRKTSYMYMYKTWQWLLTGQNIVQRTNHEDERRLEKQNQGSYSDISTSLTLHVCRLKLNLKIWSEVGRWPPQITKTSSSNLRSSMRVGVHLHVQCM